MILAGLKEFLELPSQFASIRGSRTDPSHSSAQYFSVKFQSVWYRAFLELGTSKTFDAAIEGENDHAKTGFPLGTSFVDAGDDLTCS